MSTNYVDYDFWIQGYGEGDLSQPDFYVVPGYWDAGYAQYDEAGSSAAITASALVTAKAVDYVYGSAAINCFASVSALPYPDPYVDIGYWVGGYCEYDDISPIARVFAEASLSANATRVQSAVADILCLSFVSASADVEINGSAHVIASAIVSAAANYEASGFASVEEFAEMSAIVGLPIYRIAANISEVRIARSVSVQDISASVQVVNINASTSYRE